jgi:hypothetical protein
MANGYRTGKGGAVYNRKGEKTREAPSKKRQGTTPFRAVSQSQAGTPF